jgi:hypothetical protein
MHAALLTEYLRTGENLHAVCKHTAFFAYFKEIYKVYIFLWVRSWLRHCATNRKVAGWSPDGVTGIFQWLNPSGCIVALGSSQKCVPGILPGGKDGRCVGLTNLPLLCADCLEILEPQPHGTPRPVAGKLFYQVAHGT